MSHWRCCCGDIPCALPAAYELIIAPGQMVIDYERTCPPDGQLNDGSTTTANMRFDFDRIEAAFGDVEYDSTCEPPPDSYGRVDGTISYQETSTSDLGDTDLEIEFEADRVQRGLGLFDGLEIQIVPEETDGVCSLRRISIVIEGRARFRYETWRDGESIPWTDWQDHTVTLELQYDISRDPLLGAHPAPNGFRFARFSGFVGDFNQSFDYSGEWTNPEVQTVFGCDVVTSGVAPWVFIRRLPAGVFVGCPRSSSTVRALPCDGMGDPITVNTNDAPPGVFSTPMLEGVRYRPTHVAADPPVDTDQWVQGRCPLPPAPEPTYPLMRPCGGGAEILADDEGRGGLSNARYQGTLYTVTGDRAEGDPVSVQWTSDPCPQDLQLWERCAPLTQSNRNPPNADPPIPERFREFRGESATHVVAVFAGDADCRVAAGLTARGTYNATVFYRRIDDDGGDYPELSSAAVVGGCEIDQIRVDCPGAPDPQEPVDPGVPPGPRGPAGEPNLVDNRPRYQVPPGFDPDEELRRTQQGGCCGRPDGG